MIFEISSGSTYREDMGTKKTLYQSWGVQEYFLFDPLDDYLNPRLQGFRLQRGVYQPIPDRNGTLYSRELGLILRPEAALLRLVDPQTNEPLPTFYEATEARDEALARAEEERQRAKEEAQRADAAEAKAATLLAELEKLRGQQDAE